MPDDPLEEVKSAVVRGTFYGKPDSMETSYYLTKKMFFIYSFFLLIECPNGHPYLVTEVSIDITFRQKFVTMDTCVSIMWLSTSGLIKVRMQLTHRSNLETPYGLI